MSVQQQQPQLLHGIVKQVLSGDSVVIRGQPRGGPPKEKTVSLSSITAPKLARRAIPSVEGSQDTKDEPYAWEAREFLRKKLIGKEVCFTIEKTPSTTREYGTIYIGKDTTGENVSESLVSEGLVDVRRTAIKSNEAHQKLCELEDIAKAAGKGKHGSDASEHVRDVKWSVENPRNFMDSLHQKPVSAIVEHVRDGSTVRVVLLPDFYYITMMLSGIRCPTFKIEDQTPEPFAEEAKFFTECRLLHRDVEVILESVSNLNFLGTVLHPNGSIAELLLREGFARCVDWSMQCVSTGSEKLRAAEKQAKEKRLRIWKDYAPSGPVISAKEKEFQGKVVEINNADALVVKLADGGLKKVFLASIRPPRPQEDKPEIQKDKAKIRPLYDIPYMYEAREFLRKKLIGKKVNVTVDYIQPASNQFPEKTCCTITIGGVNVAEALVSKGLATVVRYRADDDQRSAHYDELLAAETKAQKSGKGLHTKKETPVHRVVDLSGDLSKSKQFLPFLQRAGRMEAVVEFVASGSRLRLYIPRENCLITFLLAGINCQRSQRPNSNEVDPWGEEALAYTKELCMQREVEVEVEAMDKAGNFIGWLWIDNVNLSVSLVQLGFASVHFTAERSVHYRALTAAESEAKQKKEKLWENHVEEEPEIKEEAVERNVKYISVMVTEVRPDLLFFAQHVDDGPKLDEMTKQLRQELTTNAPLPGSYTPKKGDLCAALFTDGLWYRAKVEKVTNTTVHVNFVDYGNKEATSISRLAALPSTYRSLPFSAHEYGLAFAKPPTDIENVEDARSAFFEETDNRMLLLNVEYRSGPTNYVTLLTSEDKADIGKELVTNGFLMVEKRNEKRFQKIVSDYLAAQESAKSKRLNLWRYGDITEDDAKEFG